MCASACHAMPMVDGLWKGCAPTTHVCVMAHVCASLRTAGERCFEKRVSCCVCESLCVSCAVLTVSCVLSLNFFCVCY